MDERILHVMTFPRGVRDAMQSGGDAGADRAIGPSTRMECKVCWYVYDPAAGDDVWHVPAGTPWRDLPSHWTCPNCSTTMDGFLVLPDE
jgi:rubredoxin